MTAPIISHLSRRPIPRASSETMAALAHATIRRQIREALPTVDGQLWERVAERSSSTSSSRGRRG
jgi:hypothetical protein